MVALAQPGSICIFQQHYRAISNFRILGAFLLCAECDGFGSGPASVPYMRSATEQPQITAANLYSSPQIFNLRVTGERVQFTDYFLHPLFDLGA